jgi:hypothetical protein
VAACVAGLRDPSGAAGSHERVARRRTGGQAGSSCIFFSDRLAGSGCVACSRIGSSFVSIGAFTRACGGGATWSVVYGCVHVESSCGHGGIEDSAFWTNHRPC